MDFKFRRHCLVKFHTSNCGFRPSARRQLDITFNYLFTYETSRWIECQHSKIECLIESGSPPPHRASATVTNVRRSPSYADIGEAVGQAVGGRLDRQERNDLIKYVGKEVWGILRAAGGTLPSSCLIDLTFGIFVEDRDVCVLPASLRLLESCEVNRVGAEKECCSICLEGFRSHGHDSRGGGAFRTPCLHVFHGGCIVKWLEKSRCCPLCRYEMPVD